MFYDRLKGFWELYIVKMNRIFGRGKPKAPPPNLSDCIGNVSFVWWLFLASYDDNQSATMSQLTLPSDRLFICQNQNNRTHQHLIILLFNSRAISLDVFISLQQVTVRVIFILGQTANKLSSFPTWESCYLVSCCFRLLQ